MIRYKLFYIKPDIDIFDIHCDLFEMTYKFYKHSTKKCDFGNLFITHSVRKLCLPC